MLARDFTLVSISLVVPVYSGAKYLRQLAEAADAVRNDWVARAAPITLGEMIFVDDGAKDDSPTIIDDLATEYPWVVPLHLSRNFGQHAATMAGILHSAGDWVVTLDEDFQHPPDKITEMLKCAVYAQSDLVYANAETKVHESALRDLSSAVFKRIMHWATGNPKVRHFNSFRLIRGSVARAAASVSIHDTYFDVGLSWFTQRVEILDMELKDERYIATGQSGYSFRALLSHAWRMIFSSQIKLLRFGAIAGMATMGLSIIGILYYFGVRVFSPEEITVQGWTSLFLAVTFFGGFATFMIGVSLQYLSTLVLKAHGKPTFFTLDRSTDRQIVAWFDEHAA